MKRPFKKFTVDQLVNKEIALTNLKEWTKVGAIWTENQIDYGFIYRFNDDSIHHVCFFDDKEVRHLFGRTFYTKEDSLGVFCINRMRPNYIKEEMIVNEKFIEASKYLDRVTRERKSIF